MTAFPSDTTAPHGLAESAHLAALPATPLAAYALGMLHMLQRAPAAVECASSAREAMCESDKIARQVLRFLDDACVPLAEKHALVATIEHAADLRDVANQLHLHALADGLAVGDEALQRADTEIINTHDVVDEIASETETAAPAQQERHGGDGETPRHSELIPDALGCSICCDELMVKPVSLLCGHSFCKRCLDMWLKSCANCPTCRQPVVGALASVAVNVALHDVVASFFPEKLAQLEQRDQLERLDALRVLIAQSIESGQSIRELRDRDQHEIAPADVAHALESDPGLQQQVLAAEIRERLRKEKALREESRRRHLVAYCGALPASTRAHVQRMHNTTAVNARPAPTPSVQSNRPVKKYVPPPPKKSAFFGSLLRHLQHDTSTSGGPHNH